MKLLWRVSFGVCLLISAFNANTYVMNADIVYSKQNDLWSS